MTPERFREVEAIYQSAMDRPPELRVAHVADACGDDADLRRDVESLLRLNDSPLLVDQPAWQAAAGLLDNDPRMAAGTQLGPYRIEDVLGAGGMGQVYRARDTRLDRAVAVKISKEQFTERFQREARTVAALNHPNVCTLYDVGPDFLVMELVEGPTLAERIRQGPIPLEESLAIARQIADALAAAHDNGIVHRDLKPGNIKIKMDGTVKVLDFGLAKRSSVEASSLKPEDSPTITIAATQAGLLLGTAAYMSPEQARGQPADKRADIWAFGAVLYEMNTGRQLFEAATITDTLAAVLTKDPDWNSVPPRICRLLRRCLERHPRKRLRDIGDAWDLLEDRPAPPAQTGKWPWAVSAVLALALVAALWSWHRAMQPPGTSLARLEVGLGTGVSLDPLGVGPQVIQSPDGSRLAFVSQGRLFTRALNQPVATPLSGTNGASAPFFSPDGRWIAFFAEGALKKISVEGGAPAVISRLTAVLNDVCSGTWAEDGTIVASLGNAEPLVRIPASGGAPTTLTDAGPARGACRWPQVLPGGESVLFAFDPSPFSGWDGARIEVLSLKDNKRKTVLNGGTYARFLPSGHLVYVNHSTLYAVPFDLQRLETRGTPTPVLEGLDYSSHDGSAQINISRLGSVIYHKGSDRGLVNLQWIDSGGNMRPLIANAGTYLQPAISPDGRRVAVADVGEKRNIWVFDLQRARFSPLTFGERNYMRPIWSPDGRYLAVSGSAANERGIFLMRAEGSAKVEVLTRTEPGAGSQFPASFTPDGKWLAFSQGTSTRGFTLWTVAVEITEQGVRAGTPQQFNDMGLADPLAVFSPDGHWLAYVSNKSGRSEVYVRSFPDTGLEWQVSDGGGHWPCWSRTRHELFFATEDQHLFVASYVADRNSFVSSKPRLWSDRPFTELRGAATQYDLAPDGKRILAVRAANVTDDSTSMNHVTFLLNFFDELRRRVPIGK